jgi:uncharacterized protein
VENPAWICAAPVRITRDTNILVSGHSPGSGESRQFLLRILRGGHRLVLSQTMLYELEEVLYYPRIQQLYGLTTDQVQSYVRMLIEVAELVAISPLVTITLADRDDWMVLRAAIDGNSEVLCTNDGGFYDAQIQAFCQQYGLRVMKPKDLLALLDRP